MAPRMARVRLNARAFHAEFAGVRDMGVTIYLQRVVFGIGIGALFTSYFTFAADLIPQSRRTEGLALFGISGLLPLLVNPFADRIGVSAPDLRWFLPSIGGVILLSGLVVTMLEEPRSEGRDPAPLADALQALRRKPLWSVWLATAVFSGLVAVFFTFATVAAERRGVEQAPSLWFSYALGAVSVRLFGARVPDRLGPENMVAPAVGFYVGAMVLAAHAGSFEEFLLVALLAGIGHGYCFPVLSGQVVTRSPEAFRGSALAVFTALWGVTELLVAPLFGAIADRWGDAAMFVTASLGGIAALLLWLPLEHLFGGRKPSVAVAVAPDA